MKLEYTYDMDGDLFYDIVVDVYTYDVIPPDRNSWASDHDFRGYTELEWGVESFIVINADGRIIHTGDELPAEVVAYIERHIYEDAAEYARADAYDRADYYYQLAKEDF